MGLTRHLGLVSLLGACWFVAVGCGDDDVSMSGAGGEGGGDAGAGAGGDPGQAGSSAKAGSAGSAGRGGTAGNGGTAGTGNGGTSNGGTAGTTAGTAGSDAGGAGGDTSAGGSEAEGGSAGQVGSAGESTGGGAGEGGATLLAKGCVYECEIDEDCVVPPDDTSQKCHPDRKRCEDPLTGCGQHEDCVGFVSFWAFSPCETDAECDAAYFCVEVNGSGMCADKPDAVPSCLPGAELMTIKKRESADEVQVCGNPHGRCEVASCIFGCSEAGCPGGGVCNEVTGLCSCADAGDCSAPGQDECVGGVCGCSSTAVCQVDFSAATPVCE